ERGERLRERRARYARRGVASAPRKSARIERAGRGARQVLIYGGEGAQGHKRRGRGGPSSASHAFARITEPFRGRLRRGVPRETRAHPRSYRAFASVALAKIPRHLLRVEGTRTTFRARAAEPHYRRSPCDSALAHRSRLSRRSCPADCPAAAVEGPIFVQPDRASPAR